MSWLADLFGEAIKAVAKFSRKRPPEKREPFGRKHLPDLNGVCIYCGHLNAPPAQDCPGPPMR